MDRTDFETDVPKTVWDARLLLALALGALLLAAGPSPSAEAPDAGAIVRQMKGALEPERSSTRKIDILIRSPAGDQVEWTARQARRPLGDGAAVVTVLMSPESVSGFALLLHEHEQAPKEQWMYLPPVRRVRNLVYEGSYQSFLGTDFTYEDVGAVDLDAWSFHLLGEAEVEGRAAWQVKQTPKDPRVYSHVVTWVAKDTHLPIKREYYDRRGDLWKVAEYGAETNIAGVPTVLQVKIQDKQQGGSTEMRTSAVQYDSNLSPELFSPDNLPKVVSQISW